jgi:hypothetical protein
MCDRLLLDFDSIVILKVILILEELKENIGYPYNTTLEVLDTYGNQINHI